MKKYRVIVSNGTKQQLRRSLRYLRDHAKSQQAVKAVYNDYVEVRKTLQNIGGSLRLCEDEELAALGYHRINFKSHNYFLLYRVEGGNVYVDYMFHGLEDYKNKMR